ncbi:Putative flippase GtrA (transmembrane translocase of bactoprenol-linked glucose) [Lentzea xinjiangensis]|uniref:Putative flippase GtrA (Transmembrane translocase of bactoprenol-linked glucose) n=1 Tax=Lentzea xinjiangensis TaxID=402600 RepID=A0A1H9VNY2_9PSEU|nr:Putative flippase GtrA (transmembrane translocase of bactoprenol-linked glucose) [Lentzea xinjiangensis]
MTGGQRTTSGSDLGTRFHDLMEVVVGRLPFGLSRVVAPSLLGFALINGFTFAVDLLLLTLFRSGLGLPVPLAFSVAYVLAFGLSFVLNRALNFRSHAPVGPQAGLWAVAILINYLACILGVGSGLAAIGVQYHLSRIIAGACEAVFMYSVMRWIIFRDAGEER